MVEILLYQNEVREGRGRGGKVEKGRKGGEEGKERERDKERRRLKWWRPFSMKRR